MSHYFETPASQASRHLVHATIWDHDYEFTSAPGVFSSHRLDLGTRVLFRTTEPPGPDATRLLDLGCGFGPIAVALATECPDARVDAVDVNDLALQLTRENAEALGVGDRVHASRPEELASSDASYDEIWSNPPIRIGKQALHEMLSTWLPGCVPADWPGWSWARTSAPTRCSPGSTPRAGRPTELVRRRASGFSA